jgi:hypothetical protein
MTTPFSVIQVRATVRGRRLDVRRDGRAQRRRPVHRGAQRARGADPAREALRAGSADVDVVSGRHVDQPHLDRLAARRDPEGPACG